MASSIKENIKILQAEAKELHEKAMPHAYAALGLCLEEMSKLMQAKALMNAELIRLNYSIERIVRDSGGIDALPTEWREKIEQRRMAQQSSRPVRRGRPLKGVERA